MEEKTMPFPQKFSKNLFSSWNSAPLLIKLKKIDWKRNI